jgi:hypothetical protein
MRYGRGDAGDARGARGRGPEHFGVDPGPGDAPCRQAFLENLEEAGRATQVEIGVLGNPELVKQLERKMAWSIEVPAGPVFRCRPAVSHAATGRRERNEQVIRLFGKRMMRPVAGGMQPPDRPRRRGVCSRTMQHRQQRRDADTGADEDDGRCAGSQRE